MSEPKTYQNPILAGFHPDPSICRVGRDYYLATSTFEYFPGVPLYRSRDLVHFEPIGHALTRASQLPLAGAGSSRGIFAPTLRHHDGIFYLITTNVTTGGNFYVTSREPRGPWSEPVWLDDPNGIDPSLFFDDDGTVYYTRQGGGERGGIYQAVLDLARGQLCAPPKLIWSGTGGTWPEGPHLYKRNGFYYLFIAEGGTGYEHEVTVARSRSAWGPFEACPRNPVLSHRGRSGHTIQATGHGDWVQTPEGRDFFVFLGIRPTDGKHHHLGRETFLASLRWAEDGFPVIGDDGKVELEMSSRGLPVRTEAVTEPARDDFEREELALCWNFVRNPTPGSFSLAERPGFLRLYGQATSLDEVGAVSLVARRQQHFDCHASARCEFNPTRPGLEAGLVLRASEAYHYELVITLVDGRRAARLRTTIDGAVTLGVPQPLPPGPCELNVRASAERYQFSACVEGERPHVLGEAPTAALASERARTFTGTYLGMFAWAKSGVEPVPADFDWFEYAPAFV